MGYNYIEADLYFENVYADIRKALLHIDKRKLKYCHYEQSDLYYLIIQV